jgi:hypothetical protein
VNWDLDKLSKNNVIYDTTKLGLVVFVQNDVNNGTREVYQSAFEKLPTLKKTIITGLEDELNISKIRDAEIYPNPAQNYLKVSVSDELTNEVDWVIFDQRGVRLLNGTFAEGEKLYDLNVSSLPNGLHLMVVENENGGRVIRKIIIQR